MKISVIVPVYNVEKYLNKCIESIINQSYNNIEVILVDDGSTDKSGIICDEYKSDIVKVIHQNNAGLSEARNTGINASTGDYLMFIDSDDWIVDGCIEEIVELIKTNPNTDIVIGRMINYYEDINKYVEDKYIFNDVLVRDGEETIKYLFGELYGNLWGAGRGVYKKGLFKEYNIKFKTNIVSEDLECIPRIYISANVVLFYNNPYYVYRRERNGSITNRIKVKNYIDTYNVINNWIKIIKDSNLHLDTKKAFYAQLGEVVSTYVDNIGLLNLNDRSIVINKYKNIAYLMKYAKKRTTMIKYRISTIIGLRGLSKILVTKQKIKKTKVYKYNKL